MSTDGLPAACCLADGCPALAEYGRGWSVCGRHGERAGRELAELGGDYERLSVIPAARPASEPIGGGQPAHLRSPADLDAIVMTDPRSSDDGTVPPVLAFVLAWAAWAAAEWQLTVYPDFTRARGLLAAQLDRLLAHPERAGDFADGLHTCWRALQRATGAPRRPRRSACRGCGAVGGLSWDGATAACSACGGEWSGLAVLGGR